ncbi:GH92 family glycosyl hydrolase [Granulicella sp. L56]|uniref:GH92 family glycosyl hydrolase n=1 Tax=Granulicella sp. L56 TaxID=1747222 RepID=UPI0020B173DF|nr:GH92 family glycosyl hydrolase [Granulicella sp. L56]
MNLMRGAVLSKLFAAALMTVAATSLLSAAGVADRASLVNPLVGTANGGNVFPGATMPFGMVQFSPEATPVNLKRMIAAPGGYEYRANRLRGFSLTNVEGWGCAGGSGDVPLMPITDAVEGSPSADFRHAYSAAFSHADEKAEPGSYRVKLGNGVEVELAAATRMGIATFKFPEGKPARVLVRTSDSEVGSTAAQTRIDAATGTVTGSVRSGNFCGYIGTEDRRPYYTLHFVARFDRPVTETGAWIDDKVTPGATTAEGGTGFGPKGFPEAGHGSGVWLGFGTGGGVRVRIGISYVSDENAEANLEAESRDGATYEQVAARARAAWNKRLNQIETEGGTEEQKIVFTTALYHALMTPTAYSDANGEYMGMDEKVHRIAAPQSVQYANFSGWDVYRSQFQLLTWLDAKQGSDIAQSLYNQSQQDGGRWDRWTHLGGATHVMNGDPAAAAVADVWAFGGREFDAKGALASLVRAADVPTKEDLSHDGCPVECVGQRPGLDQWLKLHYIPVGAPAWGPAADTLEDVSAEFGISALAGHLGDENVRQRFAVRAQYWKNIWNPNAAPDGGYFMNRNADGSWPVMQSDDDDDNDQKPHGFTPATGAGFVEGSAAQYVWMVPFNVAGLFEQMGGREKAVARLDRFFYDDKGAPAVTNAGPLHAELNNEPSIETPWLYDFAGQPWKTQQLVRQVLNTIWKNAPDGIPGNDDLGEMSSWAVFASMGIYPEIPGRAEFVLGSPIFSKVTIHRAEGDVRIVAKSAAADNFYVRGVRVNGKTSSKTWLPESFATKGGTLEFDLSDTPDKNWGVNRGDEPPSFGAQ